MGVGGCRLDMRATIEPNSPTRLQKENLLDDLNKSSHTDLEFVTGSDGNSSQLPPNESQAKKLFR